MLESIRYERRRIFWFHSKSIQKWTIPFENEEEYLSIGLHLENKDGKKKDYVWLLNDQLIEVHMRVCVSVLVSVWMPMVFVSGIDQSPFNCQHKLHSATERINS